MPLPRVIPEVDSLRQELSDLRDHLAETEAQLASTRAEVHAFREEMREVREAAAKRRAAAAKSTGQTAGQLMTPPPQWSPSHRLHCACGKKMKGYEQSLGMCAECWVGSGSSKPRRRF